MRLRCGQCGKSVSTEVPDGTVVRAWIECPECIGEEESNMTRKEKKAIMEAIRLLTDPEDFSINAGVKMLYRLAGVKDDEMPVRGVKVISILKKMKERSER